jgi:hypothetical protein
VQVRVLSWALITQINDPSAQMVKLVDTLVSGTSGLTAVQVRVLFWARIKIKPLVKQSFTSGFCFLRAEIRAKMDQEQNFHLLYF